MRFFFVIVVVLGIFFRFANLDHKVYWYDEAITSLRGSGYTEQEVVQDFSQKSIVSVTELQRYQHPDGTRSFIDTAKSTAKEDPQHPPLYYSLLNFWFRSVGSSPALARFFPALLSLLAFPSAYWLCQEIFVETGVFTSKLPTYLMIGLIAVSPFQVLYAQESRQYSLWSVTTLLSTAALLRAVRLNTRINWGIYLLTLVSNFYTFLLAGLMMIAHGFYVMLIYGLRNRKILKNYFIASVLGVMVFLPYAGILIINQSQANKGLNWTSIYSLNRLELIDIWIQHLGRIFFDVNQETWDFYVHRLLIVLTVYAFYCLCRQTPRSVWLIIMLLAAVTTLPLMIPDLILGGLRSTKARYLIPGLLAIQLAITYLLGSNLTSVSLNLLQKELLQEVGKGKGLKGKGKITNLSPFPLPLLPTSTRSLLKAWQEKFWRLVLVVLVSGSIISCAVSSQATLWYNKDLNVENPTVAKIINQTTQPLLVSDAAVGNLLSLGNLLQPNVKVLLQPRCATCAIQPTKTFRVQLPPAKEFERFSDVFLYQYRPNKLWLQELAKQQNYKFEPVVFGISEWLKGQPVLWKVTPK